MNETESGVQALIDRIREDAVGAARAQAEAILADARVEADRVLADARTQVEAWTKEAEAGRKTERDAGLAALKGAARDVQLVLRERMADAFRSHAQRTVASALEDDDFLREVVLMVAGKVRAELPSDAAIELVVNGSSRVEAARGEGEARIDRAVLGIAREMLREGVTLVHGKEGASGIRIRFVAENVELVLDDQTLTELLMRSMLPRYASLLIGDE